MSRKRYISKKYKEAPTIECACGCEKIFKAVDKEGRLRKYISGHNNRKYENPTQYKREWNHRNRKQRYELKKRTSYKRRLTLLKQRGGKCVICGLEYNGKNAAVFDFHHREPEKKEFNLGLNAVVNFSWEKLLTESEKCDILCANCHRILNSKEY